MIRKGPGILKGMNEALAVFKKYGDLEKEGVSIKALNEGDYYLGSETLIHFRAPVLDVVKLETMYLGVLSSETTRENTDIQNIDLQKAENNMRKIIEATEGRPVMYFGARHWRYDDDAGISAAAFRGGASSCSTDIGAETFGNGSLGVGTIPHILENVMAWKYGKNRAVVESIKAFDKHIDKSVPRIALIDYDNHEITRAIECALALKEQDSKLDAVRVDTCGENVAEGGVTNVNRKEINEWKRKYSASWAPIKDDPDAKYWYGTGVTVTGVYSLRKSLDEAGFKDVKIVLSSGFGDVQKVKAFVNAEKKLGVKLFDSLGVGGIYKSWTAKMDVVAVGDDYKDMKLISKTGRGFRENLRLEEVDI